MDRGDRLTLDVSVVTQDDDFPITAGLDAIRVSRRVVSSTS